MGMMIFRSFCLIPFVTSVYAAFFNTYSDSNCTIPTSSNIAFKDVCTWTSNQYSGSWALYLNSCSDTKLSVVAYNASDAPTCQGIPYTSFSVTNQCTLYETFYTKATDFTCTSENTTYNIVAHFESDCKDGGVPFSVQLGDPGCQEGSFAPGFLGWDTRGSYSNGLYQMDIFNTTNGKCKDKKTTYETKDFPGQCLQAQPFFYNISIDIYSSFPAPSF